MKSLHFPAAILLTLSAPAIAAPIFWDGSMNTSWAEADNWNTMVDQTGTAGLPGPGDVATFTATGATVGTVNLNGDRSVSGLDATVSGMTLAGGDGNRTLSLGTGGIAVTNGTFTVGSTTSGQNVAITLLGNQAWNYNGSTGGMNIQNNVTLSGATAATLTIGGSQGQTGPQSVVRGVISDSATPGGVLSITHGNTSDNLRWTLAGDNTYSGETTVSRGGLTVGHVNALGATSAGTVVTGTASVFIRASLGAPIAAEPISLNGAGRSNLGALRNVGGDNTWTGPISLAGGSRIGADATTTFTLSNTADIGRSGIGGTRAVRFIGGGTFNINGNIGDDISVVRDGGVAVFAGDNKTYTGTTLIEANGTLIVNTALTGTSAVDVSGTLKGNSSIVSTSTVTVNSGGTIAPGSTDAVSIGSLSMGATTFQVGSTYGLTINSITGASDLLTVTTLNLTSGTLLNITELAMGTLDAGEELQFLNYTSWNGGLFTVNGTEIGNMSNTFTLNNNTFQIDYGYNGTGVALIVIPEPGSAVLALFSLCAFAARRRR